MTLLLLLAVVIFLFNLYATLILVLGISKMRHLQEMIPLPEQDQPLVSIIVPACNEEETIEPALRSLLALDYAHLEIIAVNDRSTDRTGDVLKNIQKTHPHLQIIDIEELPAGWLGKNHALHQGAKAARGDFLLFTDADILFEKTTISRAMALMVHEHLDHLALVFKNIAKGALLNSMMVDAGGGLFFLFKPWKVREQNNRNFVGVGAFNLVRKSVYEKIGGHEKLKMHPIDDIMLGKTIKLSGYRQDCLVGYDFLQVHWYESPRKMTQGLMKNIFALYNFRVPHVLAAVTLICVMTILPVWGALLTSGVAQLFFVLAVLVRLASSTFGAFHTRATLGVVPCSFLTPYVNVYILIKGMLTVLANQGINWRGTHYPLEELKKNQPIIF